MHTRASPDCLVYSTVESSGCTWIEDQGWRGASILRQVMVILAGVNQGDLRFVLVSRPATICHSEHLSHILLLQSRDSVRGGPHQSKPYSDSIEGRMGSHRRWIEAMTMGGVCVRGRPRVSRKLEGPLPKYVLQ